MVEKIGMICLLVLASGMTGYVQFHYWKERKQAQERSKQLEELLEQNKIRYEKMTLENQKYHELRHDRRKYEWLLQTIQNKGRLTRAQLVEYIFCQAEQEAAEKGIAFEVEGRLTHEIRMEELELVRLFMNLIDNAMEASNQVSHGKIRIEITEEPELQRLTLRLQNTKREDQHLDENITKDGYVSTKKDAASHGYGTQIIRRIIDENGGTIRYEDGGDTMWITCELCLEDTKLSYD